MEVVFEHSDKILSVAQFEKMTGSFWLPKLHVIEPKIEFKIKKTAQKLQRGKKIPEEQLWLGAFHKNEIHSSNHPKVKIRWIDLTFGFGVFALENIKKMQYISEYGGVIRKRAKNDSRNGYLFEYNYTEEIESPYTIDALEQGGISRFFNHSQNPNITAKLATLDGITHVLFFAKEAIAKGEELCYDYGPNYWSKRPKPQ